MPPTGSVGFPVAPATAPHPQDATRTHTPSPTAPSAPSPTSQAPFQTRGQESARQNADLLRAQLHQRFTQSSASPTSAPSDEQRLALIRQRAERLHEALHPGGLFPAAPTAQSLAPHLQGLTDRDRADLRRAYQERYRLDLLLEVGDRLPTVQDRYAAFRALAPERIRAQTEPLAAPGNQPGIVAEPAAHDTVTGATVTYAFNEGAVIKPLNAPPTIVRHLIQDANGNPQTRSGARFDSDFKKPGAYQVTFEVTVPGQPPQYYTLRQVVRDPAEKARAEALNLPSTALDPEVLKTLIDERLKSAQAQLAQAESAYARTGHDVRYSGPDPTEKRITQLKTQVEQLQEMQRELPVSLNNGAAGKPIPMQAALVSGETGQTIPLQLYAKPLQDGRWAIVDATNPTNSRVYAGKAGATPQAAIRSAWGEFVANNDLPRGQIAALPPGGKEFPATEVWNQASSGKSSLKQWSEGLGWTALGVTAVGVVGAPFTGGQSLWLLPVAGAVGGVSGGLNIADRVTYGNFQWNETETALDLLSVAGGLASVGGLAAAARAGAVIRTAEGAKLTLERLGDVVRISQLVEGGTGVAGTMIIGAAWLKRIEEIKNSNLPESEKHARTQAVLNQAKALGGIVVIGAAITRFQPLAAGEISRRLSATRLSAGLDDLVRADPKVQRALVELDAAHGQGIGAQKLNELYDGYVSRRQAGELKSGTFADYLDTLKLPTSLGRDARTVGEALGLTPQAVSAMTARELNEAILRETNPNLLAALKENRLPAHLRTAVEDVLSADSKAGASGQFAAARGKLSEALNGALGRNAQNVRELRAVLGLLADGGSVGSVGDAFYTARLATGPQTRQVSIDRSLFTRTPATDDAKLRRPDRLLINGARSLDIKTGYAEGYPNGQREIAQMLDYDVLVRASKTPQNATLRGLLEQQGITGGVLKGHDFLFLPGTGNTGEQAARKSFEKMEKVLQKAGKDMGNIRVHYLGEDGNIYRLVKRNGQLSSINVGSKFPNQ
jgi:hypothetical protein